MTTRCWFGCEAAGVAGDMLLGALLDTGADLDEVRAIIGRLPVEGWSLDAEAVERGGLAATRAVVHAPDQHAHRAWRTVRDMLAAATLPPRVRDRAHAAFAALAEVEAALHRTEVDDVRFHEVGALDAIVDIVGTCAALEVLGVDDVTCSPVATGHGTVAAAHGRLPVPAPATAKLLEGVPIVGVDVDVELATPTGAALVRTLASSFGAVPALTLTASGHGAGARDLDGRPNVVQALVGSAAAGGRERLVLVETNVDDVTGEVLAHTVGRLLDVGALDAWATPIVMKKGRPAHTVAALARPADADHVAATLAEETGTLGVRRAVVEREAAARRTATVEVDGRSVRLKVTDGRVKAEFDDAAAVAAALGVPVRDVMRRAEEAYDSGRDDSARHKAR